MAKCPNCNGAGHLPENEDGYQPRCRECWPPGVVEPYTAEELIPYIRNRYADYTVPPCRVCGAPLTIASAGGGMRTEYACSAPGSVGTDEGLRHYSQSKWMAPNFPDSVVLALCDLIDPPKG